jgi:hypothetical protein
MRTSPFDSKPGLRSWPSCSKSKLSLQLGIIALGCAAVVFCGHALSQSSVPPTTSASSGTKQTIIGTPPTPTTSPTSTSAGYNPFLPIGGGNSTDAARLQRQQLLFAEFQKKNLADTERLLSLAKELSSAADVPNRGVPSAEEVKKVEEIEKLAKRVKDRLTVP